MKKSFTLEVLGSCLGGNLSSAEAVGIVNEVCTLRRLLTAAASEMGAEDTDWGVEARALLGLED